MYSLLTEELKNNNINNIINNNINNNNNNNNNNNININSIKLINKEFKTTSTKDILSNKKEYSVIVNNFNPGKNSPPNEWQFRLIKRINSYNTLQENSKLYD
jgi:hypothetical protein